MRRPVVQAVSLLIALILLQAGRPCHAEGPPQKGLTFVPFERVVVQDKIWRPRIRTLVNDTLPRALTQTQVAQNRLRLCAEWLDTVQPAMKPRHERTSVRLLAFDVDDR